MPRLTTLAFASAAALAVACGAPDRAAPPPADDAAPPPPSVVLPASLEPHRSVLASAARAHGVPMRLLAAIAQRESRGDAEARSSAGAVGLMQLMPRTARRIAKARGMPFDPKRLDEPKVNADLAAWYLARQLAAFADAGDRARSLELAVAAYHAGPSVVRAHLANDRPLPRRTRQYVRAVLAEMSAAAER